MPQFIVQGGVPLNGEVAVSGSKNAALPILAATLLTSEQCVIKNVPDIRDIRTMIEILRSLGSEISFSENTVRIQTKKIELAKISHDLACKMRASVLLLGPLLARIGQARLPYPGGCVLGARPIDTHIAVLAQMGFSANGARDDEIILEGKARPGEVILPELSVTATENALMAAALTNGKTLIRLSALEPHVQDLANFLTAMGAHTSLVDVHAYEVRGAQKLSGVEYSITPDYLEAGTLVLAGVLTRGTVKVKNVRVHDLDLLWALLREMGAHITVGEDWVATAPADSYKALKRLQTNTFPGFPTDLQPPFAVLLTQAHGVSYIHEALFEGRFAYVPELTKMGARIRIENQHEAFVEGPTPLHGTTIKSCDIRAGAAMILAALTATGESVIEDIQYIDRGYELFDQKLRRLGARIERA